ncbi:MAG: ABC transporter permease [Candidatus Bathyarchaeia archaeon]
MAWEISPIIGVLEIAFKLSVPFTLVCIGQLRAQGSGVLDIGLEGTMLMGAVTGFLITYLTGDYVLGFLVAMLVGVIMGIFEAYLVVSLKIDQVLIGMMIWIFGIGMSTLLHKIFVGVRAALPIVTALPNIPIPLLSDIPIIGSILFNQNVMVYASYVLVLVIHLVIFKTTYGLKLRAVGENPKAADTLGINVELVRYLALVFSSALNGLGGAYMPLAETGTFTIGITGGRGWIALQLAAFGRWIPPLTFLGSLLFAIVEALAYRVQLVYKAIPYHFILMMPYIVVIITLIYIYKGVIPPTALGIPYKREEEK